MAMVVIPARAEVQVLNSIGTEIWSLIDGRRTVGEILELLAGQYDVEPAQLLSDVRSFVELLDERQMLVTDEEK